MANIQEKLVCATCGSSYFTTVRAEQFLAGGYGSAEFRSMSASPKTVLICIGCATPVPPKPNYYGRGTAPYIAEQDFNKSVESGIKYRKNNSIQTVAQTAASVSELNELKDRLSELRKEILAQAKPKAPKPKQTAVGA